jgi:hypothetical protein
MRRPRVRLAAHKRAELSAPINGLHAIDDGHNQIEDDNVWPPLLSKVDCDPAVLGLSEVPAQLMAIYDENVCHDSGDDRERASSSEIGDIH